jgi:hypothetical protein
MFFTVIMPALRHSLCFLLLLLSFKYDWCCKLIDFSSPAVFNVMSSIWECLNWRTLYSRWQHLHALFLLKVSKDKVNCYSKGLAIAQAVSRRLPTAAARVRAQVMSREICGGQSGTGAGFLRVLRFPLPILIPPTSPHSSGAGAIGQLVADVPSGLSLTPPKKETKKNTATV